MLLRREIVQDEGIIAKSGKNEIVWLMLTIINRRYYLGRRVKWIVIGHNFEKQRRPNKGSYVPVNRICRLPFKLWETTILESTLIIVI